MSCGSPMPRAEQIAKPTERDTRVAGFFVFPATGRLVPFQLFEPSRRKRILAEGPGARVSASLADQVGTALGRRRLVLDAHPLPVSAPHVEVSDETAHFIRACRFACGLPQADHRTAVSEFRSPRLRAGSLTSRPRQQSCRLLALLAPVYSVLHNTQDNYY